jgi:hypothetical protein
VAGEVRPIRTKRDHEAALKEIERLRAAKAGTRDGVSDFALAIRTKTDVARTVHSVATDPFRKSSSAARLSPIVDDVDAGAAIAGIVLPVHGHALNFGAKSAGDKVPIGFLARHVRTG